MLLRLCVTGRGHAQPPVSSARRRPGHGDLARPTDRRRTTRAGVLQRGRQRTARSPPSRRQEPRPTSWPPPLAANSLRGNARQAHQDHRNGATEGRPRVRIAKRRAAAQCTANTLSDHEHTHARRTTPGRRAPERRHGHAGSTQPRQIAQHARTNAANAAAAARARCIAARRGGHLATTHAPNATAADQRQQHGTRQTRASRKHAAKPDSASRKQHRRGQQGLHSRAASQAQSSTNGTHDDRRAIRATRRAPG